jgi:hypothetical protein
VEPFDHSRLVDTSIDLFANDVTFTAYGADLSNFRLTKYFAFPGRSF